MARLALSSANLDPVRSIYEATSRGDFSAAEWADPDIELELVDGPSPGRWVGIAGLSGTAKASGVRLADVQPQGATLFEVRHNRVTKIVIYWERETRLADHGLAPEAQTTD